MISPSVPVCVAGYIGTANSLEACPPVRDLGASDSELKHHVLHHPCGYSCSGGRGGDAARNRASSVTSSMTSSPVTSDTMTRLRVGAGLIRNCARDIRQHMVSIIKLIIIMWYIVYFTLSVPACCVEGPSHISK